MCNKHPYLALVRVVNPTRIEYGWEGLVVGRHKDGGCLVEWPRDRKADYRSIFSDSELVRIS